MVLGANGKTVFAMWNFSCFHIDGWRTENTYIIRKTGCGTARDKSDQTLHHGEWRLCKDCKSSMKVLLDCASLPFTFEFCLKIITIGNQMYAMEQ